MTASRLRRQWQQDKTVLGTFVTTPSAWIAELLGHQGYDALLLDKQHGLIDLASLQSMLRGMASGTAVPMVRVAWSDPAEIMQCLDAGAAGVVCPMISSPEEAKRFVEACRYPPLGSRSFGPIRAQKVDPEGFKDPLAFAMVETAGAIEHLENIASTPGLDGLFVGPWDLSLSLGIGDEADFKDERLLAVLGKILDACREHDLVPGIFASRIEDAVAMQRLGYRYIIQTDDSMMLAQAARANLEALRKEIPS